MTGCFRTYYGDEDRWMYFEVDDGGWAVRQVEIQGPGAQPVVAASLAEVLYLRDHAGLAAMSRYEQRYGVLADAPVGGWQGCPGAVEVSAAEFEVVWDDARRMLDGSC
jgi:hypothetical protein